jgi:hypothetical protein
MGRKRAGTTSAATPQSSEGPSKYQAVKRLVEAHPDVSRTDVVQRLRAEGIDITVEMASSYASKARKEIASAGTRRGKPARPATAAAAGHGAAGRAAATGISPDEVIDLANLVKKVGADEVVRLVEAIR